MVIFHAYTQYTLLNCIIIKEICHKKEKGVLFVSRPNDSGLLPFLKKLRERGVFDEVITYDSAWVRDKSVFTKIASIPAVTSSVFKENRWISSLSFSEPCETLYVHAASSVVFMLYEHIRNTNNPKVRLVVYEEGTGSYCTDSSKRLGRLHLFLMRKLLRMEVREEFDELLVYQPDLVTAPISYPIRKMPSFSRESIIETVNSVFRVSEEEMVIEDRVVFGSADRTGGGDFLRLSKKLETMGFVSRRHPRSRKDPEQACLKRSVSEGEQWEIICMNCPMGDKVLASYASTACFTPKSIFDEEPYIFFLYEMDELKSWRQSEISDNMIQYIQKFSDTYRDKTRIFFPKSLNEMKAILDSIQ